MTENKRFEIVKSKLIKDGWVISDKLKQFTFPTLKGDKRALISYCKALNELAEENKELKAMCEDYRKLSIQYQQKYNEKISDNTFLEKENKELKAENRQLKGRLMEYEEQIKR